MSDVDAAADLSAFPLVKPGKPTSIRRSHSVASLPTPPTTIRKRPRSRASSRFSSDDEDATTSAADDDLLGPKASPQPQPKRKKRRVDTDVVASEPAEDETAEDAFWGPSRPALDKAAPKPKLQPKLQPKPRGRPEKRAPSVTASASRAAAAATLLSPPPTRPRPPITPPRRVEKGKDKTVRPVRDSPNNPFLASPGSISAPASPVGPKTPLAEPPTMTYVFRGKKQVFVNPNYNVPPDPRSDLPETHPDYSPGERCEPRRLFGKRGLTRRAAVRSSERASPPAKRARKATPDPWSSDEDGEGAEAESIPRIALADKFAKVVEKRSGPPAAKAAGRHASEETTATSRSRNDGKTVRRQEGQPKLVLAPTGSGTKSVSASPTALEDVEEQDEEDEEDAAAVAAAVSDKDPWALSVL
ncbi:hypothetical protein K488DRAFT_83267 [Vararia minispora EC-137]|uniref:Uncharacterized protein n=1 Tax=Vararia minispora EC-137 TaxID=1314806 RepID=A0ACB8QTH0_9AGAM|nr:hypothetical protein K488DRAFT_83267 [Vararia minispora EC-137]